MKKQIKQFFCQENKNVKYIAPIIIIVLLLTSILGVLVFNTVQLNYTLQQNTIDYANDVSSQLASNISYRIQAYETYIRNLADTFSGMPEFLLDEELLQRKAEYLGMEDIYVINRDGSTIPAKKECSDLSVYLNDHPDLFTSAEVFGVNQSEMFFSAPIIRQSGKNSLLIGVQSSAMLQQMLQNVDFKNQGLCCIVDSGGSVVVSATDETPFLELKDVFVENTAREDAAEVQKALEDISTHRSGLVQVENVNGEKLLFGYDFLNINDWMLLTIVTADLFNESTTTYFVWYIAIIVFLFILMLMIIVSVIWYYRSAIRHFQNIALTDPLTDGYNELAFRMGCENRLLEQ